LSVAIMLPMGRAYAANAEIATANTIIRL
jgi:hypothetical protein